MVVHMKITMNVLLNCGISQHWFFFSAKCQSTSSPNSTEIENTINCFPLSSTCKLVPFLSQPSENSSGVFNGPSYECPVLLRELPLHHNIQCLQKAHLEFPEKLFLFLLHQCFTSFS